jgi:hypothetical protein
MNELDTAQLDDATPLPVGSQCRLRCASFVPPARPVLC